MSCTSHPPVVTLPGRFADRPFLWAVPIQFLRGVHDTLLHAGEHPVDLLAVLGEHIAQREHAGLRGLPSDRWTWAGIIGSWYFHWSARLHADSPAREVVEDLLRRLDEAHVEGEV